MSGGGASRHSETPEFVVFDDVVSIKALQVAWRKFSRGKSSRNDVADYKKNLRTNLSQLHEQLILGQYRHGSYQQFVVHDPKQRQIHKATVRDRIVHQAVVSAIESVFERRFIYDSYLCRQGKGTHAGVKRVQCFLRRESRNNSVKAYALKCDIRKFFASIDHMILVRLIERHIVDESVLQLVREIILSHSAENGKGIPLGNVTSQLFANIYLHELDWFLKQTLGVRYYARYCDDFLIVSIDKAYLEGLIPQISDFCSLQLGLSLHPSKVTIRSWQQGIDFLGYVVKSHAIVLRTKTCRRAAKRVSAKNISSYTGLCAHASAFEFVEDLKNIAWKRND